MREEFFGRAPGKPHRSPVTGLLAPYRLNIPYFDKNCCHFSERPWVFIKMKVLILFLAWCILLALCWPLALVALVLAPIVWLLSLPFRLIAVCIEAVFSVVHGLLLLPGRLLRWSK